MPAPRTGDDDRWAGREELSASRVPDRKESPWYSCEERLVSVKVTDMAKDRLWTPDEVSTYLGGVPVSTLYQWRYKGIGPKSRRVGRHLRYRPEDVRAWVEEQD